MNLMSIARRAMVVVQPGASVTLAAQLMREHHASALVVMSADNDTALPMGVVTDRDLVLEVLAQEVDPDMVTVGDVTLGSLITAHMDDGLFEAVAVMSREGLRHLVVVDDEGALVGLVSMDDLIAALSKALGTLAQTVPAEVSAERFEGMGRSAF